MSAINQKEYLKRYLAGADDPKKKKKKKKKDKLTNQSTKGFVIVDADLGSLSSIPFGMDDQDDAPTIAEITYDSVKTKLQDEYQANVSKWKKTAGTVEGGKENDCHGGELRKAPVEETLEQPHLPGSGSKSVLQRKQRHDSDSDDEPSPKKTRGDGVETLQKKQRHDSDSDESSQKTQKVNQLSESPVSKKVRHDSGSDESPPRHVTQTYNPKNIHADNKRNDSISPPRLQSKVSNFGRSRGSRWDFDESKGNEKLNSRSHTTVKRSTHDSDESPPRKSRSSDNDPSKPLDSDESPPRRKYDSDESPPRKAKNVDSDESPPRISSLVGDKTTASRPEKHMTTSEYLQARKRGKLKKDSPEELARKERESELQREAELKHKQWNRGVAQLEQQQQRVDEIAHEMTKSFARSADDVDMNEHCKSKLLADDPMLEYLSNKKGKKEGTGPRKPLYEGPFPPNRFNIRPGYRWDGVDRSNSFEQDYFAKQSSKIAIEEDAYKYCAEDM